MKRDREDLEPVIDQRNVVQKLFETTRMFTGAEQLELWQRQVYSQDVAEEINSIIDIVTEGVFVKILSYLNVEELKSARTISKRIKELIDRYHFIERRNGMGRVLLTYPAESTLEAFGLDRELEDDPLVPLPNMNFGQVRFMTTNYRSAIVGTESNILYYFHLGQVRKIIIQSDVQIIDAYIMITGKRPVIIGLASNGYLYDLTKTPIEQIYPNILGRIRLIQESWILTADGVVFSLLHVRGQFHLRRHEGNFTGHVAAIYYGAVLAKNGDLYDRHELVDNLGQEPIKQYIMLPGTDINVYLTESGFVYIDDEIVDANVAMISDFEDADDTFMYIKKDGTIYKKDIDSIEEGAKQLVIDAFAIGIYSSHVIVREAYNRNNWPKVSQQCFLCGQLAQLTCEETGQLFCGNDCHGKTCH